MVVAVRCPEPNCRKYQLVEEVDHGKVVNCLICQALIRVPASDGGPHPPDLAPKSANPPAATRLP